MLGPGDAHIGRLLALKKLNVIKEHSDVEICIFNLMHHFDTLLKKKSTD